MFKEITECRACGSKDLQMVVDLGPQMVVDFVERRESVREAPVPLQLSFCKNCKLVQLMHEVNRDRLYKKFWYKSGINEQMRQALRDVANKALTLTDTNFADHILDIGCNDGTLLELFDHRYFRVGVDPCRELVHEANHTGRLDVGVVGYFGLNPGILRFAPYKIITAIAMFYDVPNPEVFLQHCKQVLHADGTIVIQMNYLKMMLEEMSFDNICHEHLMYYSLMSLEPIIQRAGLEISGAEVNDVNGGSLRLYLTHAGKGFSGYRSTAAYRVSLHAQALQLLKQECMMELDKPEAYLEYAGRIAMTMEALRLALAKREVAGKRIFLYGASTRGSTLLQTLAMSEGFFTGAAERDQSKWGRQTVGTWVPIVSEETARKEAQVFFVLPHHFRRGIELREKKWLADGGELIFPLPRPVSVTSDGVTDLLTGMKAEELAIPMEG